MSRPKYKEPPEPKTRREAIDALFGHPKVRSALVQTNESLDVKRERKMEGGNAFNESQHRRTTFRVCIWTTEGKFGECEDEEMRAALHGAKKLAGLFPPAGKSNGGA